MFDIHRPKNIIVNDRRTPFLWEERVSKEIVKLLKDSEKIIAVQTARQAGKDNAIYALIKDILSNPEKKQPIIVIQRGQQMVRAFKEGLKKNFTLTMYNNTCARIIESDANILYGSFHSFYQKGCMMRYSNTQAVILNDADMIPSGQLIEMVGMIYPANVVMFGTNREDGENKSDWLYYLNHPDTHVYKIVSEDNSFFDENFYKNRRSMLGFKSWKNASGNGYDARESEELLDELLRTYFGY